MSTSNKASVLKDVVAYVDVWSSEKTANYSKPFVQQLQEMGAQISKKFNKQVTHVVFNNGHLATWRKAKKSNVKLVSVLWVGRCYDDEVHVDEDLYPAINDESNPVLKNKKHRCMQPKDSPERTNRRIRKKLDKMMKDLAPKQPLVTDVSPIIIDEENGIVYSPALKRSAYMAERLKDMKEKRENLSPTDDQSDDDYSATVGEPGYSPRGKGRTQTDQWSSSEKPWLSPCQDLPKRIPSPLKCPDFQDKEDDEGNRQQKSKRISVRERLAEKHPFPSLLESSCQKRRLEDHKERSPRNISEKGKKKIKAAKSFTETKTHVCPDAVNSTCSTSQAILGDTAVELSKDTSTPQRKKEQNVPKRARLSVSTLVQSLTIPGNSKSGSSYSTSGDDAVFEDYFSPANHHQSSKRSILPNLHVEKDIQIPFSLDPTLKKRKQRRSESTGSETNHIKKRKRDQRHGSKNVNLQSDESSEPQSHDVKEALPQLDSPRANCTQVSKRRRQSTLSFTRTSTTISDTQRRASSSVQPTFTCTEAKTLLEPQKKSDAIVISHTLESKGNEVTVAAGLTEDPSEEEDHNKQVIFSLQKMVNKTKAVRTLVMTSMSTEKQQMVVQVVKSLGGFTVVDRVCESTTHVVSGSHRRTLNILFGIARGCWILSFEWILWCLEQRQWIPEEPYELSDQFPSAQICRLQRHLSAGEHQQDLFQGQPPMFVSQQSQPPTQSLVELIQLCGGTVCKTVRQAGICIGKYSGRRPEGSRILSEQWVLDGITHLKLLPYDNYDLE
ncbi:hypothetical protein Q5P01_021396 [Channa striata]|uniref:BRCT domain-containing protein n=1 Tax=Channa striata TaxID=64152 RepID=A0AA88LU98_CHASR|nr:hypothetical protein Q5P01_021396 [Channa striata]